MEEDPKTIEDAIRIISDWRKAYSVKLEEIEEMNKHITELESAQDAAFAKVREECADRLCGNCPSDGVPGMCKKGYCGWRRAILGTEVYRG